MSSDVISRGLQTELYQWLFSSLNKYVLLHIPRSAMFIIDVEGSIFWSYGLVSFARYLGTFAGLGWAWNRASSTGFVSAEFVESFAIFLYGATNMWMERFGAHTGDPFTTKQIQHIGIAVKTVNLRYISSNSRSYLGHVLFCWSYW